MVLYEQSQRKYDHLLNKHDELQEEVNRMREQRDIAAFNAGQYENQKLALDALNDALMDNNNALGEEIKMLREQLSAAKQTQ
jgi:hypothetical protein